MRSRPSKPKMKSGQIEVLEYVPSFTSFTSNVKSSLLGVSYLIGNTSGRTSVGGFLRRHDVKYTLPESVFAFALDPTKGASDDIKSNKLIKDYSYFYAEAPFSTLTVDKYNLRTIVYEIRIYYDDKYGKCQIPSFFPPNRLIKAGTITKHLEVKGNLSLKVPESKLPSLYGISFESPVSGFKEWSANTIYDQKYDLMIPEIESGTCGNDYAQWKFTANNEAPIGGSHAPVIVFGMPKRIFGSSFSVECTLTVDNVTIPPSKVPIEFKDTQ